jgi:hypothetical protein
LQIIFCVKRAGIAEHQGTRDHDEYRDCPTAQSVNADGSKPLVEWDLPQFIAIGGKHVNGNDRCCRNTAQQIKKEYALSHGSLLAWVLPIDYADGFFIVPLQGNSTGSTGSDQYNFQKYLDIVDLK